jgi:hypothetical protein
MMVPSFISNIKMSSSNLHLLLTFSKSVELPIFTNYIVSVTFIYNFFPRVLGIIIRLLMAQKICYFNFLASTYYIYSFNCAMNILLREHRRKYELKLYGTYCGNIFS